MKQLISALTFASLSIFFFELVESQAFGTISAVVAGVSYWEFVFEGSHK